MLIVSILVTVITGIMAYSTLSDNEGFTYKAKRNVNIISVITILGLTVYVAMSYSWQYMMVVLIVVLFAARIITYILVKTVFKKIPEYGSFE